MKEKFLVLQLIDASQLEHAFVRSLLNTEIYIEIGNMFIVSCVNSFRRRLRADLNRENIFYLLIYINIKAGSDVIANGVNNLDFKQIENIVLDKS